MLEAANSRAPISLPSQRIFGDSTSLIFALFLCFFAKSPLLYSLCTTSSAGSLFSWCGRVCCILHAKLESFCVQKRMVNQRAIPRLRTNLGSHFPIKQVSSVLEERQQIQKGRHKWKQESILQRRTANCMKKSEFVLFCSVMEMPSYHYIELWSSVNL